MLDRQPKLLWPKNVHAGREVPDVCLKTSGDIIYTGCCRRHATGYLPLRGAPFVTASKRRKKWANDMLSRADEKYPRDQRSREGTTQTATKPI